MSNKQGIVIALMFVLAFLAIGAATFSPGNLFCKQSDENTGDCVTIWNGGNISVYNNQGSARKFFVNGDSGNVTIGGTLAVGSVTSSGTLSATQLYLGSQAQSGAVRFGVSSVYTTGATIAHGFTVTPTMCLISPGTEITATYTISAAGFSSDTATRATPVYWMCGK